MCSHCSWPLSLASENSSESLCRAMIVPHPHRFRVRVIVNLEIPLVTNSRYPLQNRAHKGRQSHLIEGNIVCEMQQLLPSKNFFPWPSDNPVEDENPVCATMLDEFVAKVQQETEFPKFPADCTMGQASWYNQRLSGVVTRNFRSSQIHRFYSGQNATTSVPCFQWGPWPGTNSIVDEPIYLFNCSDIDNAPVVRLLRQLLTRRNNTTAFSRSEPITTDEQPGETSTAAGTIAIVGILIIATIVVVTIKTRVDFFLYGA